MDNAFYQEGEGCNIPVKVKYPQTTPQTRISVDLSGKGSNC